MSEEYIASRAVHFSGPGKHGYGVLTLPYFLFVSHKHDLVPKRSSIRTHEVRESIRSFDYP